MYSRGRLALFPMPPLSRAAPECPEGTGRSLYSGRSKLKHLPALWKPQVLFSSQFPGGFSFLRSFLCSLMKLHQRASLGHKGWDGRVRRRRQRHKGAAGSRRSTPRVIAMREPPASRAGCAGSTRWPRTACPGTSLDR